MGSIGGKTNLECAGRAPGEGGEGGHGGLGGFGGSGACWSAGRDLPSQILGNNFRALAKTGGTNAKPLGGLCHSNGGARAGMAELGVTEAETQQRRTKLT